MDLPLRPGDILTPYAGAKGGTPRLPLEEVETLTPIPVLPCPTPMRRRTLLKALGARSPRQAGSGSRPSPITLAQGPRGSA